MCTTDSADRYTMPSNAVAPYLYVAVEEIIARRLGSRSPLGHLGPGGRWMPYIGLEHRDCCETAVMAGSKRLMGHCCSYAHVANLYDVDEHQLYAEAAPRLTQLNRLAKAAKSAIDGGVWAWEGLTLTLTFGILKVLSLECRLSDYVVDHHYPRCGQSRFSDEEDAVHHVVRMVAEFWAIEGDPR